jgi:hypothetical protein
MLSRWSSIRAVSASGESCEREVVEQLVEMQRNAPEYARRDGLLAEDELFYATRNAVDVQSPHATTARCSGAGSCPGTYGTGTWPTRSRPSPSTWGVRPYPFAV